MVVNPLTRWREPRVAAIAVVRVAGRYPDHHTKPLTLPDVAGYRDSDSLNSEYPKGSFQVCSPGLSDVPYSGRKVANTSFRLIVSNLQVSCA